MIITTSYTLKVGATAHSFRMNTDHESENPQASCTVDRPYFTLTEFLFSVISAVFFLFYFTFVLLWGGSWFTNLVVFKLANMPGRGRNF